MSEKSSYEKINYSLRPAKSIERKMFCQALQKLSHFNNIENYRYVGFGSTFFCDFALIHRLLGITNLISIEKDEENSSRFNFNRPFSCIKTIFMHSNDALPTLEWHIPTILWLDYDYKLNSEVFKDIKTFFSEALPSSMFIITLDIKPDIDKNKFLQPKKLKTFRITELRKRVGRENLPEDIRKKNLGISGNIETIHEIIEDQINEILRIRNGLISNQEKQIEYEQVFNFLYNDGTPMLTLGGVIFEKKQRELYEQAKFDELEFTREKNDSFNIEIPNLTFREIFSLDELLPNKIDMELGEIKKKYKKNCKLPELKKDDIKKYAKIYRYFPNFAETNF